MALTTRSTLSLNEDLTDEQIDQMLVNAAARLKEKHEKQETKGLSTKSQKQNWNFPKLNVGNLQKPIVNTKGDIASLQRPGKLEPKQNGRTEEFRKVEDPVNAKKLALEVCY